MRTIIVSGALANKCFNGGEAWVRLSWATGLKRLGFDVYFIEQISSSTCVDAAGAAASIEGSINLQYFRKVVDQFGLSNHAALISSDGNQSFGISTDRLEDIAESAELLVNISGHLCMESLLRRIRCKAYIDIDPGFTQFWHADPVSAFSVSGHDFYFTIGENIGSAACPIPMGGIHWRPIRQPVVLEDWPVSAEGHRGRFTTVASWRGAFGPVNFQGRSYGLKVHEFRKQFCLPANARASCLARGVKPPVFEIALDIHPADGGDFAALREHGWQIADPVSAAGDPHSFRRYVQCSGAEFSVAQGIYVETQSGWFSDRTIRYLASAKPALVQETGFSRNLETGRGLIGFSSHSHTADLAADILANYSEHSEAARAVAEDYFDSDKVLTRMLDEVGVSA